MFGDDEQLKALNAIVHPEVGAEIQRRMDARKDTDDVVVLDVPLLVESKAYVTAGTIVVDTDPEIAVQRLVAFRGFTEADARARMARQATREDRLAAADLVVHNDGTPEELEPQIEACWDWIQGLQASEAEAGEGARP